MKQSGKYKLNLRDLLRGLAVAALTAVIAGCGQIFEEWLTSPVIHFDKVSITLILKAAFGGMVGYLIKNFFTPSDENQNP